MARTAFQVEVSPRTYNQLGRAMSMSGQWITLEDSSDAARFHIGMDLRAGMAADRLRSGSFRVAETDEESGAIRVTPENAIICFCSGDLLFWSAADQHP